MSDKFNSPLSDENSEPESIHHKEHCKKYHHYPPAVTFVPVPIPDPYIGCYIPHHYTGCHKPHPQPPMPPYPPCECEPGLTTLNSAQFQLKSGQGITVLPQAQIPFNTEIYNDGKFALDISTGAITIAEAGIYKVDYQFDLAGVNPPTGDKEVLIALMLNDTEVALMSCNVGVGQFGATNIVKVTDASSVLTLKNKNTFDILIPDVTVQANITLMKIG